MSAAEPMTTNPVRADDEGYPKGIRAAVALLVLCLVCAVLTMDYSLVGLLVEPVKLELGLTDAQIGILQGPASSISYALCAIPAGMIIDRVNRVQLVAAAVAIWAVAMLCMSFATSFWVFVGAKVVVGVVMAILLTAPFSLIADVVPPNRRARSTSILVIGQYIGGALGFLAGGLIFDAVTREPALFDWAGGLSPWRVTYVLFALPCLLILPLLFIMQEPTRKEREEKSASLLTSLKALGAYRALLWPLIIGYGFQVVADSTTRSWLSPALMRLYHLTPGEFGGWIGGTVLIGGIVGSALGGWLAERAHSRSARMTAAVISAVLVAASTCLALVPSVPFVFALFVVGVLASGVLATITTAVMITYVPNELRGLSTGILILIAVGPGLAIGPTLVPAVSEAIGGPLAIGRAIAFVGVPAGLLAALFYAFVRTRREDGVADAALEIG